MSDTILTPRKALKRNKSFLKTGVTRERIDIFKSRMIHLLDSIDESESEEHCKNHVADFLKGTYYSPKHAVNTKGRTDLVIHSGNTGATPVGVIIEAKRPANVSEMLSQDNINTKAMQELILYYLRERITGNNLEIKHLIATNAFEWFIFDASDFEKYFAEDKTLTAKFRDFEEKRLAGSDTPFFYREIAAPAIDACKADLSFVYFDIRDYDEILRDNPTTADTSVETGHALSLQSPNNTKADDIELVPLFKIFSPEFLLKLPFANDSNSLNKEFYGELLHIMGLTEVKRGGKKLIERKKKGDRHSGSLLESIISEVDSLDRISRMPNRKEYGATEEERLFRVALELTITWINRILFLRLLEAQLIGYHKGDKSYGFLNLERIPSLDHLNSLFFKVLAKKIHERNEDFRGEFDKIPYLNSSLFEPTALEHNAVFISQIRDDKMLPILSNTVLKDRTGKKITGELPALDYLFRFLAAYDFSSEGTDEIREESRTLINASVLGLIFEKINGYQDGSFFTPGFITMYMCRETIRKAVIQKFNEAKKWKCKDFSELKEDLRDEIKNSDAGRKPARKEANEIVNSLKICDPAVGSGHFLVSALNEIIAIKSELGILADKNGERLDCDVAVANDELTITDIDGNLYEYHYQNPNSALVQETLFSEKQTIIENCLFGVDININSVKICRLRLWIELLKNACYIDNKPPLTPPSERGEVRRKDYTNVINTRDYSVRFNNIHELKYFRKELRSNPTPAEKRLWKYLQGRKLSGRKFRRQHSIGGYILDFYCPAERLAVELDGEVHNSKDAKEYDFERDLFLNEFGVKVLRFENQLVFENPDSILNSISSEFGRTHNSFPYEGKVPEGRKGLSNHIPNLQTLPNIDINIKCGNSLISRFDIDADISKALKDSKWDIEMYRRAVNNYRNTTDKAQKRELVEMIDDIKNDFKTELNHNDPRKKKLYNIRGDIEKMTTETGIFEMTAKQKTAWNKKLKKLTADADKIEKEIEDIKNNRIYDKAFEWRFEFPEVLDDKGNFVGFDVVIGNPPYGVTIPKEYTEKVGTKFSDSSESFIQRASIIAKKIGYVGQIVPKSILFANSWSKSRAILFKNKLEVIADTGISFEEVILETVILLFQKIRKSNETVQLRRFYPLKKYESQKQLICLGQINQEFLKQNNVLNVSEQSQQIKSIFNKINKFEFIRDYERNVFRGIYLPDKYKEVYLDKGDVDFINKVPDVKRYSINRVRKVELSHYKISINKMKLIRNDRIIIKVLRGNRIAATFCSKDILTTEKLVNLIIPSLDLYFILGILNARLVSFYFNKLIFSDTTETSRVMDDIYLKNVPMPELSTEQQQPIITLVDKILEAKAADPTADTSELEKEIDRLVYDLYELTDDEIAIVEGA